MSGDRQTAGGRLRPSREAIDTARQALEALPESRIRKEMIDLLGELEADLLLAGAELKRDKRL
ncbi:MAG: hypothetical protein QNI84_17155 [Henriciella sp.]|nr:hypothetical protein [Henriciella sp.]